ncbi:ATP-binding protein [Bradyrhizobium iriomotense]|uniref:ATP-binding protein n=1 Tax=Bradyrhizobium iriomotense TaxID=441950 RepID=UPI001B8A2404|nr:ATP-binding protein [Bradyrhizobium iriomotense]MBR0786335.1 ATP-binding protein [Bradyrhizobium iriomotense]
MIESIAFQTKARTLDHLGREQIADCPTAISELWKNSFDAYARSVYLDIFDGAEPVAAVVDDGHGMNRREFVEKWLVVGTESKAVDSLADIEDRNGLDYRPKQGQKGIGRLSCANLGPLLLFVSKRRDQDFVAALLDWRLFENPFLNLADVQIPVVEFSSKRQLFELLGGLYDQLMENVWGGGDVARQSRIRAAWNDYDALQEREDARRDPPEKRPAPSARIAATLIDASFEERHIAQWPVWSGASDHGTALLVSQINFDLQAQLPSTVPDAASTAAREKFTETLSNFVDPYISSSALTISARDPQFAYEVRSWAGDKSRTIVGVGKEFNRQMLDPIEHIIDGVIDINGVFRGRIKAFGEWRSSSFEIQPPQDLVISKRPDAAMGPIDIYIAAMEFEAINSTLTTAQFTHFRELAKRYAGFMMFRDGLRIMPYGRTDNDFFEIEMRRSKSAGREFWNHRQMFGRLGISRARNPNLKDKAGREGLLDNNAAKALKIIVSNILMKLAREFFGSASDIRTEILPEIQEANRKAKATEERNKLRRKQRSQFSTKLRQFSRELPAFLAMIREAEQSAKLDSEKGVEAAQASLGELKDRRVGFNLGETPQNLGSLESAFKQYRSDIQSAQAAISGLDERIQEAIKTLAPTKPREFAQRHLARNGTLLSRRISTWRKRIDVLQKQEFSRMLALIDQRNKAFHLQMSPLLNSLDRNELSLPVLVKTMDDLRERMDRENANLFEPYISALESLGESIDLEHLANFGMEEVNELRQELDRLNSLAQLGIAVEIIGHEMESYDDMIRSGLNRLPPEVKSSSAAKDIEFGCEGLTDQLRFLSPLKLSGHRPTLWVTGEQIFNYIRDFFGPLFVRATVSFEATPEFKKFRVYDQPSRLYPVFINLVNNSLYWVGVKEPPRKILLSAAQNRVVVSDTGPGVDSDDVNNLFSLFFTRKLRGGRGVGLYLCRANLAAGGHKISYLRGSSSGPELPGANFVIEFRGAEYGE